MYSNKISDMLSKEDYLKFIESSKFTIEIANLYINSIDSPYYKQYITDIYTQYFDYFSIDVQEYLIKNYEIVLLNVDSEPRRNAIINKIAEYKKLTSFI